MNTSGSTKTMSSHHGWCATTDAQASEPLPCNCGFTPKPDGDVNWNGKAWVLKVPLVEVVAERDLARALEERDRYHDYADELARVIGVMTGGEIGEHSNLNNPWENALELAHESIAAAQPSEPAPATKSIADALRMAIRQNSHEMLMTGDEIRQCEAALALAPEPSAEPKFKRGDRVCIIGGEGRVYTVGDHAPATERRYVLCDHINLTIGAYESNLELAALPETKNPVRTDCYGSELAPIAESDGAIYSGSNGGAKP